MRVLVLCTGNRCRSQMAEGWLRRLAPDWTVRSAGINPAGEVHPPAKRIMKEAGIREAGEVCVQNQRKECMAFIQLNMYIVYILYLGDVLAEYIVSSNIFSTFAHNI